MSGRYAHFVPPPFVHEFRIRWGECDPQGIVFNANYVAYIDDTIGEIWRSAFGSYEAMTERGVDMVVAELNIVYHGSGRPDQMIRTEATIERLGNTSMITRIEIFREQELLIVGRIRHVFIDYATWSKVTMPEWVRDGLRPYLAPSE